MDDPFADLETEVEPDPKEKVKPTETIVKKEKASVNRSMFVFDFETVPDESRYPRPECGEPVSDADFDPEAIVALTVSGIGDSLKSATYTEDQLNAILTEEQSRKKPRKGVIDAVESEIKAPGEMAVWVKDHSVNPLRARIVAFGWSYLGGDIEAMIAENDDQEREILTKFWQLVGSTKRRCGYNIFHFDDLLAITRSIILGVPVPKPLDRRKYGNHTAVDLQVALFPAGPAQKCKDVVKSFGITPPAGEMEGSQVFDLYEKGELKLIADYVVSDVYVERELYLLLADALSM